MADTRITTAARDDLVFWLRRLALLVEQDRVQAEEIKGLTLPQLVELAKGNWNAAQGEVDKLKS